MKDTLQDIVARLMNGEYKNEEHVRVALVCRLLRELGWEIWNPREVFTEYQAMPTEDATRVDVALFIPPQWLRPAVFIEVKAVGRLIPFLDSAELQLRDYNRNNQADLSVLTDGQVWKFYLPSFSGEFSKKCFLSLDLFTDESQLVDIELELHAFLSKQSLQSGKAIDDARKYLKRSDTERIMAEVIPIARRDAEDDPSTSLVDCFRRRCIEKGIDCNHEQAKKFVMDNKNLADPTAGDVVPLNRNATVPPDLRANGGLTNLPETVFRLSNRRGANATGAFADKKRFLVFADSFAAEPTLDFRGGSRDLHDQLVRERYLTPESNAGLRVFRLVKDYTFSSSSAAASVFCGCSSSGPREWEK